MSDEPVYRLKNVSYQYIPSLYALQNVNLTIHSGERIAFLGQNGCGKSTLQKILAGLLIPEGEVQAFGAVLTEDKMRDKRFAAAFHRRVGFVFQNADVQIFCSSVIDEIMFGPLNMGLSIPASKQRAEELMDFCGIRHLAERLPHHLSGGEKKKVVIAAVLATAPDVLILDEPTNGLDPKTQRWMIDTLEALHHAGKTILIATHLLEQVLEFADRALVLGETHRILADAPAREILMDRDLLLAANLIDERYHVHIHGTDNHVHIHRHLEKE